MNSVLQAAVLIGGSTLLGTALGFFHIPGTQELAGDHRTAGSQRRKQNQDHRGDHIHQGNTGNGCFTGRRYHHTIGKSHKYIEKLFKFLVIV